MRNADSIAFLVWLGMGSRVRGNDDIFSIIFEIHFAQGQPEK
jgi:hypothetical protein